MVQHTSCNSNFLICFDGCIEPAKSWLRRSRPEFWTGIWILIWKFFFGFHNPILQSWLFSNSFWVQQQDRQRIKTLICNYSRIILLRLYTVIKLSTDNQHDLNECRPSTLWEAFYSKVLYTTYERMKDDVDELVQTLDAQTLIKDDALVYSHDMTCSQQY